MTARPVPFTFDKGPAASAQSELIENQLAELCAHTPVPLAEQPDTMGLYLTIPAMRRMMYFDRLYQQILDIPGTIMVFGVRWGRDLAWLQGLRDLYEPNNHARRIVGFDTFEGFIGTNAADDSGNHKAKGAYGVTNDYKTHLDSVLKARDSFSPFKNAERTLTLKGDAPIVLQNYLNERPETMVAMAYFDMDLYQPTRDCATIIKPYLQKGSLLAFDEVMLRAFPGETQALREVFGRNPAMRRFFCSPAHASYMIYEGDSR